MMPEGLWLAVGIAIGVVIGLVVWAARERKLAERIATSAGLEAASLPQLAQALAKRFVTQERFSRDARRRLAHMEASLDGMDEGVSILDSRDSVLYANKAFRSMLGDDLRTVSFQPIVEVSRQARRLNIAQDDFESDYPARSLRIHATSLDTDRVLVIIRDVTEALLLEKVRRDFAAAASHELKTPAASIKAAAETILASVDDDPLAAKRFASKLLSDSERLIHLVGDLLDLSRLESGPAEKKSVRLDEIVREETDRFAPTAETIGLQINVATEPLVVQADPGDIRLAVSNLLDNATRYTKPGGAVAVTVDSDRTHAWVEIEDTGIGIPRDQLDRIFERFYRVDQARSRDSGGTGLGLALVKHIADRHGGRIEAHSELGKGSRFRLILPTSTGGT